MIQSFETTKLALPPSREKIRDKKRPGFLGPKLANATTPWSKFPSRGIPQKSASVRLPGSRKTWANNQSDGGNFLVPVLPHYANVWQLVPDPVTLRNTPLPV